VRERERDFEDQHLYLIGTNNNTRGIMATIQEGRVSLSLSLSSEDKIQ
jgi:hypothetical protein